MRIRRISIRNSRGVTACDVSFPPDGVTIIEGPNEVGKSSLAEALDLLLEYPHDSQHRSVKSVKPVHRDAGPEVEAELTTGAYHVVFSKRWARQPQTTLKVIAPYPETLVGRTAHDRMQAILDETLDRELFKALRFIQGDKIGQSDMHGSTTLVRALDQAATGGMADPETESTLWEAVQNERLRYFTPAGKITQRRERLQTDWQDATAQAHKARLALQELEEKGELKRQIAKDHARLEQELHDANQKLDQANEQSRQLADLELKVERRKAALAEAESNEKQASDACNERTNKVDSLRSLREQHETLQQQLTTNQAALAEARAVLLGAEENLERSTAARKATEDALQQAEAADELDRARNSLYLLGGRQRRVVESHETEAKSAALLESCPKIDKKVRATLEKAWRRVLEAKARSEAASPTIEVEALCEVDIAIDEVSEHLVQGDRRDVTVATHRTVRVDDRVLVHARNGTSNSDLQAELAEAEREMASLVLRYELVSDDPLGSADEILAKRRSAQERVKAARKTRADALEDLTEDQLEAKRLHAEEVLRRAGEVVEAGQQAIKDGAPSDDEAGRSSRSDAAEATQLTKDELAKARNDARHAEEQAARAADLAARRSADCKVQFESSRVLLNDVIERLRRAEDELERSRTSRSDQDLKADLAEATTRLTETRQALDEASLAYHANNPDKVKLELQNAQMLTDRLRKQLQELDIRQVETETILTERGAADLQDAIDTTEPEAERLGREHREEERRAAAAHMLYEAFSRKRDESRLAYVAPYSEQINRMAKLVFGPGTVVTVNPDDFSLTARSLDDATVPFEDLSTGAREQLAVLARLACAILVNPAPAGTADEDAGVPVILDDALGYSDHARLQSLAVAFSEAARIAQVIVMTSTPERYGQIGNATLIRLPQQASETEAPSGGPG